MSYNFFLRKYELRKSSFKINNIVGKHKYYTKKKKKSIKCHM